MKTLRRLQELESSVCLSAPGFFSEASKQARGSEIDTRPPNHLASRLVSLLENMMRLRSLIRLSDYL